MPVVLDRRLLVGASGVSMLRPAGQVATIHASGRHIAAVVCLGIWTACAGTHTSEQPTATVATEPEPSQGSESSATIEPSPPLDPQTLEQDQHAIDHAANRSEALADQTAGQVENAREHASVPGEPSTPRTDLEVAVRIRRALSSADGLSPAARSVDVAADHERVTLHGSVESAAEKAHVEEIAKQAAGGKPIVSELGVRP